MEQDSEATIEDLLAVPEHGGAELVNGKIILIFERDGHPSKITP